MIAINSWNKKSPPPPQLFCAFGFCCSTKTRPSNTFFWKIFTCFDLASDRWSMKSIRLHRKKLLDESNTQIRNSILQGLNGGKEKQNKSGNDVQRNRYWRRDCAKTRKLLSNKIKVSTYTKLHCKTSKSLRSLVVCKLNCLLHVWL